MILINNKSYPSQFLAMEDVPLQGIPITSVTASSLRHYYRSDNLTYRKNEVLNSVYILQYFVEELYRT